MSGRVEGFEADTAGRQSRMVVLAYDVLTAMTPPSERTSDREIYLALAVAFYKKADTASVRVFERPVEPPPLAPPSMFEAPTRSKKKQRQEELA